jgi:hypothetical protein
MIDILKSWISIECPNCRFSNSVRFGDVSLNKRALCSGCHRYIYLVDKEVSTYRSDKNVNNTIKELENELSKLSRGFKITF